MYLTTLITSTILQTAVTTTVLDSDLDGLTDKIEISLGTDYYNSDTDADGYSDGEEVMNGYNPLGPKGDRSVTKRVELDLSSQKIYYFFNDVKIGGYYVSTGLLSTKTPVGEFAIMRKVPTKLYRGPGYYLPNTLWNMEFKRSYYLHSAYWHNDFGVRPRSHGCINMTIPDAEHLYRFLDVGSKVKIYGKTPTKKLLLPAGFEVNFKKSAPVAI